MSVKLQSRAYAAIALSLSLTLYAVWLYFSIAAAPPPGLGDYYGVAAVVERFRSASAAVPPGTRLGYLTDLPADNSERLTIWTATRYAMAPALLEPDTGSARLVLGDLRRPGESAQLIARNGLRIERDFGNGVFLLRRAE